MTSPRLTAFPILAREWRSRFRRDRAFLSLGLTVAFVVWLCWSGLQLSSSTTSGADGLARLSHRLLTQLVWVQTFFACWQAPLACAPLIAREREVGVGDELLLTPLSPLRVALEKALAGAGFVGLVLLALLPLNLVVLLLSNKSPFELWPVFALIAGCLMWGASLGTACSAHARRASGASRSASGLTLLWLGGSFVCATLSGNAPFWFPLATGRSAPFYVVWFGRTNPIMAALELLSPSPFEAKWPVCAAFLVFTTPLFLWLATRGLLKPLAPLPLLSPRFGKDKGQGKEAHGGVSGVLARLEVPLVGNFAPRNPVLGREVRGKFRLRQPPLPVLLSEIVLGVLVAGVYVLLVREAMVDPAARETIFWGVAWAGLCVAILNAITHGASALSRERENGTWESLSLSLLTPAQIVRGKLIAGLGTSIGLSVAVWPLLLLCVDWSGSWTAHVSPGGVQPFQLLAGMLIWLGTLWLQTIAAMLIGVRAKKAASAISVATLLSLGWMFGSLFLLVNGRSGAMSFLGITNPLVALSIATDPTPEISWAATGWPFALFALGAGAFLLALVERAVAGTLKFERHPPV